MLTIYAVREITAAIKDALEGEFPFLWVRGQVSNLSRPRSGHVYFTLKDEAAALSVVWFRSRRSRPSGGGVDPLTGEVLMEPLGGPVVDPAEALADGQEVMAGGRITVYPPRGQYQLAAELVQDVGLGQLHLEFEALKQRYAALGYFAPERKRLLPAHPARVAVVTAPDSAAMRDFLRLSADLGWGAQIRVYPALVQGEEAPGQIAGQLDRIAAEGWADVAVCIRGGGSLEDLWAFNTEPVVEAIFRSPVPVVAGVGHEVDVSLADMVADVRASTPSHAAQLLWPERRELAQAVDELETALKRAWGRYSRAAVTELAGLERELVLLSPRNRLEQHLERFDSLARRLARSGNTLPREKSTNVDMLTDRLRRAGPACVESKEIDTERLMLQLQGLNPEKPLELGYSLVWSPGRQRYVRSVADATAGDALQLHVSDGVVEAEATGVQPGKPAGKG